MFAWQPYQSRLMPVRTHTMPPKHALKIEANNL